MKGSTERKREMEKERREGEIILDQSSFSDGAKYMCITPAETVTYIFLPTAAADFYRHSYCEL